MPYRLKTLALVLSGLAIAAIAIFFGVVSLASLESGYAWAEMDWNGDGSTSVSEFLAGADIGARGRVVSGIECTEYFADKDGLPIKVVCPRDDLGTSQ